MSRKEKSGINGKLRMLHTRKLRFRRVWSRHGCWDDVKPITGRRRLLILTHANNRYAPRSGATRDLAFL